MTEQSARGYPLDVDWLRVRYRRFVGAFWVLPALIVGGLLGLAWLLVTIDEAAGESGVDFAFSGGAAAARSILSSLASSVITVSGLVFSIMIVTLQLVSAQYTPRALRTFLDDRITQIVAGSFVGIFGYSLLVLRTVRGGEATSIDVFVPSLALSVSIILGIVALGLLIVFVHHMSQSIQVSTIAARLTNETLDGVERLYPERGRPRPESSDELVEAWRGEGEPGLVRAPRPGFVQAIDLDLLARRAAFLRVRLHVVAHPGLFVTGYDRLVEVWPASAADGMAPTVRDAVHVADERDLREDISFGVRQLADIALRALSPGVNDPTTAVTCIGYLRAILEALAARELPAEVRRLEDATIVAQRPPFAAYVEVAFAELSVAAAGQPRVAVALAEALSAIAGVARGAGFTNHARACERTADEVEPLLLDAAQTDSDREQLRRAFESIERDVVPVDGRAPRAPSDG